MTSRKRVAAELIKPEYINDETTDPLKFSVWMQPFSLGIRSLNFACCATYPIWAVAWWMLTAVKHSCFKEGRKPNKPKQTTALETSKPFVLNLVQYMQLGSSSYSYGQKFCSHLFFLGMRGRIIKTTLNNSHAHIITSHWMQEASVFMRGYHSHNKVMLCSTADFKEGRLFLMDWT